MEQQATGQQASQNGPTLKDKSIKRWAVGVTTCPVRRDTLLPATLRSIEAAGFPRPRLFVDGVRPEDVPEWERLFNLEVTARWPALRVAMNWHASLLELYFRDPDADMYGMFQDDLLCCSNLRKYLDRLNYPDGIYHAKGRPGYLNLYTAPSNQQLMEPGVTGFRASNQLGKGAVALVFSKAALLTLLSSHHLVERPQDKGRGWKLIDGGIVDAMRKAGWAEYVHNPSLVLHTGKERSWYPKDGAMAGTNGRRAVVWDAHYDATSFPGEGFDAMQWLVDMK